MMGIDPPAEDNSPLGTLQNKIATIKRRYQKFLDDWTPYSYHRWGFTAVVAILYILRIFLAEGWYIITYAIGIYLLQLFLAFLTPKFDPALEELEQLESGGQAALPTRADDEFKPFIRRLPEFKFWHNTTRAFCIALFCSMFRFFDVPVFWPILLMYWILLVFLTMRRQIQHMIKYRYIPFNFGKKRYTSVHSFKPK